MIESFDGNYAFLSNFAKSPITFNEKTWPTVDHVFQAAKTFDVNERERIRLAYSPGKAKYMGRKVSIRSDWEQVKQDIMLKCIRLKFKQNHDLKQRLLQTENFKLIEGNTSHDNFWGDCKCSKCQKIPGKNFLGQILMNVRKELK